MSIAPAAEDIRIKNVGPIQEVVIHMPADGGVVLLRGGNGTGKTHGLQCVQSLIDGQTKVPKSDGAARGVIDGCGLLVSISNKTMRNGELSVESIEGRYDLDALHDPHIDKADSADAERIKNLLRLSDAKADIALFAEVVPENEWPTLKPDVTKTDDLVLMASRIKRDLHEKAKAEEDQADNLERQIAAAKASMTDVNMEVETDEAKLTKGFSDAAGLHSRLTEQRRAFTERSISVEQDRARLKTAEENYHGPTVDAAVLNLADKQELVETTRQRVESLERELDEARHTLSLRASDVNLAQAAVEAAKAHERLLTAACENINSAPLSNPTDTEITDAGIAMNKARMAIEAGHTARMANEKRQEVFNLTKRKSAHDDKAASLRQRAAAVDDVLSRAVACPQITIKDGRMYTQTDRGEELFAELSDGERFDLAVDIAIDCLLPQVQKANAQLAPGQPRVAGLLKLSQDGWQHLDVDRRRKTAAKLKGTGIVLVTAECTSGPLTVEEFSET